MPLVVFCNSTAMTSGTFYYPDFQMLLNCFVGIKIEQHHNNWGTINRDQGAFNGHRRL